MKIENIGIENEVVELARLTDIMEDLGFVLAGQWDYERVTFDRKFENKGDTFYLRLSGYTVEGDIGGSHAMIKLMTPLLGKHYYPHGVEYGEGENFPSNVVATSKSLLAQAKQRMDLLK
ncbi:YugN family protein [Sutcliffiella deserti]|uniref:YugN family protein n=1 Tax=Sutcliffiella deserti TaxID=2875501 RepID=UPI001CBAB5B5|nr:YugN family protein [Sutcliffiella deserti]